MLRHSRPPEPECLRERGALWTERWIAAPARRAWRWPRYGGTSAQHLVTEALRAMSAGHCAYCDGFPFTMSTEEVEHFRPKATFRALAFAWSNLFLSCSQCNAAKQRAEAAGFDERLLKPDEPGYHFERYFIVDFATGALEPNPAASEADRSRAEYTVRAFGLNAPDRARQRLRACDDLTRPSDPVPREEAAYRFMLDALSG
jgi:uncharacterized protein (TIGR02646 family)